MVRYIETDGNTKHLIRRCDGVEDFIDNAIPKPGTVRVEDRASYNGAKSFTQTNSFDEAVKLLRGGWTDGLRKVAELSEKVTAAIGAPAPEMQMVPDVQGGAIDMGAYLAGEPESMTTWFEELGQHKIVHFVINMAASAGVNANSTLARGAVIAATIDALESAGNRCVVDVLNSVSHTWRFTTVVRIKDAQDPLDMERLAFAVAHPSMLRRLTFGHYENEEAEARGMIGVHWGYGTPQAIPKQLRGDVNIEKMLGNEEWPISKAVATAIGWMRDAGIELDGFE